MMSLLSRIVRRVALGRGTDVDGTIERVAAGAVLSAENLWLLGCSAIIACIGLDVSSAAVVIGAMLISPLMGPILGVGLAMGTGDRSLLQRSLRELSYATILTVVISAAYFLVSPFGRVTVELAARTRPNLLDVGIAFFGGVAGIVAGSRRSPSLALPGAAIATALMPPLCTAGFGLATGEWRFLLGAGYLYAINAIFIALATYLIVRMLRFPLHPGHTAQEKRRDRQLVAAVALLAAVPSAWFLYQTVLQARERQRIDEFVHREIDGPRRAATQWEADPVAPQPQLRVYVAGHPIEGAAADSLAGRLAAYGLERFTLDIVQSDISADDLSRMRDDVQRTLLRAVSAAVAARDSARLAVVADSQVTPALARELAAAFPEIRSMTYVARLNLLATDSVATAPGLLVEFAPRTPEASREEMLGRIAQLVRIRLDRPRLQVRER